MARVDLNGTASSIEADNRLASDGEWSYLYDREGNLTQKRKEGERWTYQWDNRNRLITIKKFTGPDEEILIKTIENGYDGLNRWITRSESYPNPNHPSTRRDTFVHNGNQVELHYVGGNLDQRYLWGEYVDQLLAEQDVSSGDVTWTLTDHLGSVRDRVSQDGTPVQHQDFDAFGNIDPATEYGAAPSASATDAIFSYTGRQRDSDTGDQYNTNRWYNPETGRWLSQDPIGFAAGDSNLYRYVGNQPTTKSDPSGLVETTGNDPPGRPGTVIGQGNGVTIQSHGTNDVHKPAHAHVHGGGREVRIGANGKPLEGQPELTATQRRVVCDNLKQIRKEVNKVGRASKRIEDWEKAQRAKKKQATRPRRGGASIQIIVAIAGPLGLREYLDESEYLGDALYRLDERGPFHMYDSLWDRRMQLENRCPEMGVEGLDGMTPSGRIIRARP